MAKPAFGEAQLGGVFRHPAGENPGRKNKAVYLALAIYSDGCKEVLGIWIEQTGGSEVLAQGHERVAQPWGARRCPHRAQRLRRGHYGGVFAGVCANVHRAFNAQLKEICRAATPEAAAAKLEEFETSKWGSKYSSLAAIWRRPWEQVIPFYAYPPEIRKVIYTSSASRA